MTCQACTTRQKNHLSGAYQSDCLQCAAALVISAQPLKAAQEGHLHQLTRRGLLTRETILAEVGKSK